MDPPREFDVHEVPASPVVVVTATTRKAAECPRCRREMVLNQGERIPRDGWSWLWWACICGAVTASVPVRLKDRT